MTAQPCSALNGQQCRHGHSFSVGCVRPEWCAPVCVREDMEFNERMQTVRLVRIDWRERFADWKARQQ